MSSLKEITELLYAAGVPMPGSSMSDEEALSYARKNFPSALRADGRSEQRASGQ